MVFDRNWAIAVAYLDDGRLLLTRGETVEVLDEAGEVLREYQLPEYGWAMIQVCPDQKHFISTNFFTGMLAKVDMDSGADRRHDRQRDRRERYAERRGAAARSRRRDRVRRVKGKQVMETYIVTVMVKSGHEQQVADFYLSQADSLNAAPGFEGRSIFQARTGTMLAAVLAGMTPEERQKFEERGHGHGDDQAKTRRRG